MSVLEAIRTDAAAAPTASYSQGVIAPGIVASAGQVGRDPATGRLAASLGDQVAIAISNLRAVLAAVGLGLEDVIKTTCFLANIDDFAEFDAVYKQHFTATLPARSTVGVALAGGLLFEIEAWAVRQEAE